MKYCSTTLLLILSLNVLADDRIIYRWVSEDNVVHFSQNQPASGQYTEIRVANTRLSKDNAESKVDKKSDSTALAKSKKIDTQIKLPDLTEQCEEAKNNLATLTNFARVRFVDENGETQMLDDEQQKEQISINEKRIEVYCK